MRQHRTSWTRRRWENTEKEAGLVSNHNRPPGAPEGVPSWGSPRLAPESASGTAGPKDRPTDGSLQYLQWSINVAWFRGGQKEGRVKRRRSTASSRRKSAFRAVIGYAAREGAQQLAEMAVQAAVTAICPEADIHAILDTGTLVWGGLREAWSRRCRTRVDDEE